MQCTLEFARNAQCEAEDTYTCYVGETSQPLKKRCAGHRSQWCSSRSVLANRSVFPSIYSRQDAIERVIDDGVDPRNLLRDWFSHVTKRGIHPGHQRMSVVDIIPSSFLRKNRERNLVAEDFYRNGDFDYLGQGGV